MVKFEVGDYFIVDYFDIVLETSYFCIGKVINKEITEGIEWVEYKTIINTRAESDTRYFSTRSRWADNYQFIGVNCNEETLKILYKDKL